jgi:hypothetical protein
MSKLMQLLRGSRIPDERARKSNTLSTIADLMERNRRFEVFMRQKVAELERQVAEEEAIELDETQSPVQIQPLAEQAVDTPGPDRVEDMLAEDPYDVPELVGNDAVFEAATEDDEAADPFTLPTGRSLLPTGAATLPPISACPVPDWQAIPGLGGAAMRDDEAGAAAETPSDDEIDGSSFDEADSPAEWAGTLYDGPLEAFE